MTIGLIGSSLLGPLSFAGILGQSIAHEVHVFDRRLTGSLESLARTWGVQRPLSDAREVAEQPKDKLTCAEWYLLRQASLLDVPPWARRDYQFCFALSAVVNAKPSATSYFDRSTLATDLFSHLDLSRIGFPMGGSFRDQGFPTFTIKQSDSRISIRLQNWSSGDQVFEVLYMDLFLHAAGDFDGDGVEDVLISTFFCDANNCENLEFEYLFVTRLSPGGPLIVKDVELNPPPAHVLQPRAP